MLDVGQHRHGRHTRDALRQQVASPRVSHQACRDILVGASVDEKQLAAAALLGGRAQQAHPSWAARLLESSHGAQEACKGATGNQVVAAGVADAWQRVVLGVEDDEAAP